MASILFFALRRRFTDYFRNADSVIGLVLRIAYIAFLALNAGVVGWLIDRSASSDQLKIDPIQIIFIVNAIVCGLWVWMEFFPAYKQRSKLVSKAFPIPFHSRWLANLFYDTATLSVVGTALPFFILKAVSKTYTSTHLLTSLLLLVNAVFFVQLVKAFLEATHRRQGLFLFIWVAQSVMIVLSIHYWLFDPLLTLCIAFAGQLLLLFLLDRAASEITKATVFLLTTTRLSPVYLACINNAKSRNAFGFGFIFKIGFLVVFNSAMTSELKMGSYMVMLYLSPAILFTYVANNLWGYFPALWITSTLGKRSDVYRTYGQLILIPVLIDLAITLALLAFRKSLTIELVCYYGLVTLSLTLNGLVFSLYKAFYVHNGLNFGQMKSSVNSWSVLTTFLVVMLAIGSVKMGLITALLYSLGLVVITVYLFRRRLPNDPKGIHRTYESLFLNRE
ncbi:hypothetical protein GCM10028803_38340 [Larkinella knui]|uniref:Uncharacterized protein n=1 Tax=Larkinella knui TaxID=2025310 RepID=A0A3P1CEB4_9BACT|nr:hypothetical protein [Larkinella knui]RRB11681.1 hypothetical protein EHT87_24755 [Larkinella knui]